MAKTRSKRIALYATETTTRQIQTLQNKYDLSVAAVIRQAVAKWYASEPVPPEPVKTNGAARARPVRRHAPAGATSRARAR